MRRVRDGTITLDDHAGQNLEVVRQSGTGLFMIRSDHLFFSDFYTNPPLNGLILEHDPSSFLCRKIDDWSSRIAVQEIY